MPMRLELRGVLKALAAPLLPSAAMLVAILVAILGSMPAVAAAAFDLTQLTQLLASKRAGEATFVETREVSVLDRTVTTSGRLSFEAPDTFVRENLKPLRERVAVVGNTLTMSRGERSRSVALDSVPEAAVIIEAIRGTLTGNRDALQRVFDTSVAGNAEHWTLDLVPREARLRTQVSSVRVTGRRAEVREMQVVMPDGDRSTMTIEPIAAAATSGSGPAR